jgi:hypothetical protein
VAGYADPELAIAEWLHQQIGSKVWTSWKLPSNERFLAPLTHVLRAPSLGALAIPLDEVLLDADTYSADEDTCREVSRLVWNTMVFQLPGTTFDNGVFVKKCTATPPTWAPDPSVYRRTAAYTLVLHGLVT